MNIRIYTWPNLVTLVNLLLGCGAVVCALTIPSNTAIAFWLLSAAAVCDFADGWLARLLKQHSEVGLQLDSLADVVSFGVAPASILFAMYRESVPLWTPGPCSPDCVGWPVFVVAAFSALRLAKFNVDKSQATEFKGLPTPASALMVAALGWISYHGEIVIAREFILLISFAVSYLLVCPVRMFSLKSKNFEWRGNELRYGFLAASVVLVGVFQIAGIALAVVLYIVVSTVRHFYLTRFEKF